MIDLPSVNATRLIRALQRSGFFVHHVTGGHYVLKHPDRRFDRQIFQTEGAGAHPALTGRSPYYNRRQRP